VTETIAGVTIPDSRLITEATELVRDSPRRCCSTTPAGVPVRHAAGPRRGLNPDPELLYVGAMFHDLGLTEKFRTHHQRFEVDGADEARRFLTAHGIDGEGARECGRDRAAHHRASRVHERRSPWSPRGGDRRTGHRLPRPRPEAVRAVTEAHPRPDFKRQILAAFTQGFADRPDTTFGTVNADVLAHFSPDSPAPTSSRSSRPTLARVTRSRNRVDRTGDRGQGAVHDRDARAADHHAEAPRRTERTHQPAPGEHPGCCVGGPPLAGARGGLATKPADRGGLATKPATEAGWQPSAPATLLRPSRPRR